MNDNNKKRSLVYFVYNEDDKQCVEEFSTFEYAQRYAAAQLDAGYDPIIIKGEKIVIDPLYLKAAREERIMIENHIKAKKAREAKDERLRQFEKLKKEFS